MTYKQLKNSSAPSSFLKGHSFHTYINRREEILEAEAVLTPFSRSCLSDNYVTKEEAKMLLNAS